VVSRSCRTAGERGFIVAGRAVALYVVNDALGSFLLRASEAIDQVADVCL